jgi:hypothetical protein
MEAASTSETSVNVYHTTRRNVPEDSNLHARRCETLKSHSMNMGYEILNVAYSARIQAYLPFSVRMDVSFVIKAS